MVLEGGDTGGDRISMIVGEKRDGLLVWARQTPNPGTQSTKRPRHFLFRVEGEGVYAVGTFDLMEDGQAVARPFPSTPGLSNQEATLARQMALAAWLKTLQSSGVLLHMTGYDPGVNRRPTDSG